MLSAGVTLVLGTGLVLSYMQAQPEERLSDLTLANIEAMAMIDSKENTPVKLPCKYTGDKYDHCLYIVITTDGKTKPDGLDGFINEEIL